MGPEDVAPLALRLWIGVVMLRHGRHHLSSLDGTASWFASKGFRNAELNARASAYGELAIGSALVLGLATPFAAAGVIATMLVAFWSIHRFAGFFVFARPDEGYEYVVTLAVAALALALLGPGAASFDEGLGLADSLDGWIGGLVALAGLAAGGLQLLVFWRQPAPQDDGAATEA